MIHQLKTDLEQKNELDLKVTKLESSIVNSVTTMHNQEKEDMINKLKADLEQQQLSCLKTSELDTNLQTLNNHLEKLVTMNTDLSEKTTNKTIENTELVANEVHSTCEAVSKNNDTNVKINSNMSIIYENLRKHVRSVSIMNENVSKPDVRKPLIETSNRYEPLSFLNEENQNESQYVDYWKLPHKIY